MIHSSCSNLSLCSLVAVNCCQCQLIYTSSVSTVVSSCLCNALRSGCLLAGGSKRGSNVSFIRQTPKFLQGHVHLLGARTDADVQEQLTAKREMPQWDSDDDEAAEKEVQAALSLQRLQQGCHPSLSEHCRHIHDMECGAGVLQ